MIPQQSKKTDTSTSMRIAVFIDAGNLWGAYKKIGKMVDFEKLPGFFAGKFSGDIFKIFYYVAYPPDGTRPKIAIDNFHKFLTFLKKKLRYNVVKKPLKTINLRDVNGGIIYDQKTGKPASIEKGNLDVELAIDAIRYVTDYDVAVFVTGDSDFLPVISYLRNLPKPKIVYVFSTEGCVSMELRTGSNGYFDIKDFPQIHREKLLSKEERQNKQ